MTVSKIIRHKPEKNQKSGVFPEERRSFGKLIISGSLKPGTNPAFFCSAERLSVVGSSRLTPGGMGKMWPHSGHFPWLESLIDLSVFKRHRL